MSPQNIEQAKTLLQRSDMAVAEIERRLSVSRTALYREFPDGRSGIARA